MFGVKNIRLVDYLAEKGIYPVYDDLGVTFYWRTQRLFDAVESYFIKTVCIPNKGY